MAYLVPSEFVTKMVDAGESKIFMSTRDTVIRAYMAGAILTLAAWFAVTMSVNTGQPIIGAILFPVGFCMLYLFGFDLLTGVFVLCPLALIDKRPGVTLGGVLRNWGLVFIGNFGGAFTVAVMALSSPLAAGPDHLYQAMGPATNRARTRRSSQRLRSCCIDPVLERVGSPPGRRRGMSHHLSNDVYKPQYAASLLLH